MPMHPKNTHADNFGYEIIVISKNDCPQCDATKRKLDDIKLGSTEVGPNAVAYLEINAETDTDTYPELEGHTAFDYVTKLHGVRQMPFVIVRGPEDVYEDTWHGLRPDKLSAVVRAIVSERDAADATGGDDES